MKVRADGTRVIYNEPSATARRPAARRPVPSSELLPVIRRHSDETGLDPHLIRSVIEAESSFDASAVSSKGALGLMQLMPATAASLGVSDPFDVNQNVRGGVTYLRQMLDRFGGRLDLALAAYNAGPSAVERHGGVPPFAETRSYVRKVLSLYRGGGHGGTPAATESPSISPPGRGASSADALRPRGRSPRLIRRPNQRLLLTTDP